MSEVSFRCPQATKRAKGINSWKRSSGFYQFVEALLWNVCGKAKTMRNHRQGPSPLLMVTQVVGAVA